MLNFLIVVLTVAHIYKKDLVTFFFFFSSRRRHTRFDCDWSSDVCSSDLDRPPRQPAVAQEIVSGVALASRPHEPEHDHGDAVRRDDGNVEWAHLAKEPATGAGSTCRKREGQRPHTVNDDPQPQPPVAFGFSKANPDSWKLLL